MNLNYKVFGAGFPIIILHGLLGSLDNWQTIAKKIAEKFQVFIIDQRNHGRSPHSEEFSYEILSNDLLEFLEQRQIKKAHIIGHSMGGKTAMEFALKHPSQVGKIVVVDVAPVEYEDGHSNVFSALFAADIKNKNSRKEVEDILRQKLNNEEATVQFLMKGLHRAELGQTGFQWKFNLGSLWENYPHISKGITSPKPFTGEILFIKGGKSSYIQSSNYHSIVELFPNHQLIEIPEAGHWVHAERPTEFTEEIMKFLI